MKACEGVANGLFCSGWAASTEHSDEMSARQGAIVRRRRLMLRICGRRLGDQRSFRRRGAHEGLKVFERGLFLAAEQKGPRGFRTQRRCE